MRNKKIASIFALALACLLLAACNRAGPENPYQPTESETKPATTESVPFSLKNPKEPKRIAAKQARLVFDRERRKTSAISAISAAIFSAQAMRA